MLTSMSPNDPEPWLENATTVFSVVRRNGFYFIMRDYDGHRLPLAYESDEAAHYAADVLELATTALLRTANLDNGVFAVRYYNRTYGPLMVCGERAFGTEEPVGTIHTTRMTKGDTWTLPIEYSRLYGSSKRIKCKLSDSLVDLTGRVAFTDACDSTGVMADDTLVPDMLQHEDWVLPNRTFSQYASGLYGITTGSRRAPIMGFESEHRAYWPALLATSALGPPAGTNVYRVVDDDTVQIIVANNTRMGVCEGPKSLLVLARGALRLDAQCQVVDSVGRTAAEITEGLDASVQLR